MNSAVLSTIAATGFTVAFFHAAIPTHWLPFVLVARARAWSRAKTLGVVALAGLGHVGVTTLLGFGVAWVGVQLGEEVGEKFAWVAGGLLFATGLFFFWRQWRGGGVRHHHVLGARHRPAATCGHAHHGHSHWEEELEGSAVTSPERGEWAAIGGLFLMLTLSPCEGFLPIYLSGVQFGWRGFAVLSAILAVGALAGMLLFTWLTLVGLERFNVKRFERFESALLGAAFCALGALVILIER